MNGVSASLAIAASTLMLVGTAPAGTKWSSDYRLALKNARMANRPLVVVLEDPSRRAQSLEDAVVLDDTGLLGRYELCRVDVTTRTGRRVAEAFGAEQYPYTAVTDSECKFIVHRQAGGATGRSWVDMLAARTAAAGSRSEGAVTGIEPTYWPRTCYT